MKYDKASNSYIISHKSSSEVLTAGQVANGHSLDVRIHNQVVQILPKVQRELQEKQKQRNMNRLISSEDIRALNMERQEELMEHKEIIERYKKNFLR